VTVSVRIRAVLLGGLLALVVGPAVEPVAAQTNAATPVPAPTLDQTTVIVVRHTEKLSDEGDPSLSAAGVARAETLSRVLADLPVAALFASQYKRTRETLTPLSARFGIPVQTHDARDVVGLARIIRSEHAGQLVVVAGHSNTVPALMRALGVESVADIPEDEYDDLFVVRLNADGGATALHLNYGAPSGS
jgi:broad specificity phosphatase PhoE